MTDETLLADDTATETTDTTIDPVADPVADPVQTKTDDDWRSRLAGDDSKLLGYLARVPSEKALAEQVKRYNDDMKAGKYIKPLGADPTEAELADWRKAMGVPEGPTGYFDALPEGLVVGDDDKPFVETFMDAMHGQNAPPAMVSAAIDAYYNIVAEQAEAEAENIRQARAASEDALREEWGADYRRNLNVMNGYLNTLPEGVSEAIRSGAGPDGIPLANNPEVLRWLASLAIEANPVATVVPGAGSNQASAIADEIASIEKMMGNRGSDYWRGPNSAKMQARYLELVTAREKLK